MARDVEHVNFFDVERVVECLSSHLVQVTLCQMSRMGSATPKKFRFERADHHARQAREKARKLRWQQGGAFREPDFHG